MNGWESLQEEVREINEWYRSGATHERHDSPVSGYIGFTSDGSQGYWYGGAAYDGDPLEEVAEVLDASGEPPAKVAEKLAAIVAEGLARYRSGSIRSGWNWPARRKRMRTRVRRDSLVLAGNPTFADKAVTFTWDEMRPAAMEVHIGEARIQLTADQVIDLIRWIHDYYEDETSPEASPSLDAPGPSEGG